MFWRWLVTLTAGCMVWAQCVCAGELKLTVLDAASGKPIANASVAVRTNGSRAGDDSVQTGADGQCSIWTDADASYVGLLLRHDGYVTTHVAWDSREKGAVPVPATFTVRLPAGRTISGHIVDADGAAVPDAKVYLKYRGQASGQPAIAASLPDEMVESDAGGVWVYSGAPAEGLDRLSIRVEHPDFVSNQTMATPPAAALLDGTATTRIDRGVDVAGQVVGADGKPIGSAEVSTVRFSNVSNDYGIKVTADAEGRFTLPRMASGELPVTVTAKGFSPELQRVEVKPGMKPMSFKLSPGRTVKGIVLDGGGKPVAGARVHIQSWRDLSSLARETTTSADGRFQMADAPTDQFSVWVERGIYSYGSHVYSDGLNTTINPGDVEATIRFPSDVQVKGTVTDAKTGKGIDRFQVLAGSAPRTLMPPTFGAQKLQEFTGGTYELSTPAPENGRIMFLRVEAEGYEPFVSGPVTGSSVALDAALRLGHDLTGTVCDPDGKPLAGVKVWRALPGAMAGIEAGRGVLLPPDMPYVQTDEAGHFRFGPETGSFDLLVFTDAGFTITPATSEQSEINLKLNRWSSIEGTYNPTGQPAAESLVVNVFSRRDMHDPRPRYSWSYQASTDAQGHYRVDRVPSYDGQVMRVVIMPPSHGDFGKRCELPVLLKAGQTSRVDAVAARACGVTGKMVAAKGEQPLAVERGYVRIMEACELPMAQRPASFAEAQQLEGALYMDSVGSDGSFAMRAIPPGRYEYSVDISSGEESASVSGALTIPADMMGKDIDLGTLAYDRRRADVGLELPKVLGKTLDGQPIKAQGLAGKYVVVVVWESDLPAMDECLPYLEKLAETFGKNGKVALVSINTDADQYPARHPATVRGNAWTQGYVTLQDHSTVSYLFGGKWPTILIAGPDGKILAKGLTGSEVAGRLTGLLARP